MQGDKSIFFVRALEESFKLIINAKKRNELIDSLTLNQGTLEEIIKLENLGIVDNFEAIKGFYKGITLDSINEKLYTLKEEVLKLLEESNYLSTKLNIHNKDAIKKVIRWTDIDLVPYKTASAILENYYLKKNIYQSFNEFMKEPNRTNSETKEWIKNNLEIDSEHELITFLKYKSVEDLHSDYMEYENNFYVDEKMKILIDNYGFSIKKASNYLLNDILQEENAHFFLRDIEEGENFYDAVKKHVWGFIEPSIKKSGKKEFEEKPIPPNEIDLYLSIFGFETKQEFIDYAEFKREYNLNFLIHD